MIYGYDIDSTAMTAMSRDTGATVNVDLQGSSYTTQFFPADQSDYIGLYRVDSDGSLTITTTDTESKAYAVILRPQWHGQTDSVNSITIPGSRLTEAGDVRCVILNPYGTDGVARTSRVVLSSETSSVSTVPWYTGVFQASDSFRHYTPGPLNIPVSYTHLTLPTILRV